MAEQKAGARTATSYKVTIGGRTFSQDTSDGLEHLVIEEMPERAVPDVVQQPRDAQRFLDERG